MRIAKMVAKLPGSNCWGHVPIQTVGFTVTSKCSVILPLTLCSISYVRLELKWEKQLKKLRGWKYPWARLTGTKAHGKKMQFSVRIS
jgi:hypothetical protein